MCLLFKYSSTSHTNHTLNDIFNHIQIIMIIIHNNFINKHDTKIVLNNLIKHQYINSHQNKNKTIYSTDNIQNIKTTIYKRSYDKIINQIININENAYLSSFHCYAIWITNNSVGKNHSYKNTYNK